MNLTKRYPVGMTRAAHDRVRVATGTIGRSLFRYFSPILCANALSLSLLIALPAACAVSPQECTQGGALALRFDDPYYSRTVEPDATKLKRVNQLKYKQASSTFYAGLVAFRRSDYPSARDAFAQSAQLYPSYGSLFNLAVSEQLLADFSQAKNHYLQARSLRSDDPELETNLGFVLARTSETDQASSAFAKALDLIDANRLGPVEEGRTLLQLGIAHFWHHDLAKALQAFEEAGEAFERGQCPLGRAIAAYREAYTFFELGQTQAGEDGFGRAIEQLRALSASAEEAAARTDFGLQLLGLKRMADARSQFVQSVELARAGDHRLELARALNGMGSYYLDTLNYDNALPVLRESLDIFEKLGNIQGEAQANNNLAALYERKVQYGEALSYLLKANELSIQSGSVETGAIQLIQCARLAQKVGDSQTNTRLLKMALELSEQRSRPIVQASGLLAAAELQRTTEPESAQLEAVQAKRIFDSAGYSNQSAEAAQLVAAIERRRTVKIAGVALLSALLLSLALISIRRRWRIYTLIHTRLQLIIGLRKRFLDDYATWARGWLRVDPDQSEQIRDLQSQLRAYRKKVFRGFLVVTIVLTLAIDFYLITYQDLKRISDVRTELSSWDLPPALMLQIYHDLRSLDICILCHFLSQALLFCVWLLLVMVSVRFLDDFFYGLAARFGETRTPPSEAIVLQLATNDFAVKRKATKALLVVLPVLLIGLFLHTVLYPGGSRPPIRLLGTTLVFLTGSIESWLLWQTFKFIPTLGISRPTQVYDWLHRKGRNHWVSVVVQYLVTLWALFPLLYMATRGLQKALTYRWLSRISQSFSETIFHAAHKYHNLFLSGDTLLLPTRLQQAYLPAAGAGEVWAEFIFPLLPYALASSMLVFLFQVTIPWLNSFDDRATLRRNLMIFVVSTVLAFMFDLSSKFLFHYDPGTVWETIFWLVFSQVVFVFYMTRRVEVEVGPPFIASPQRGIYHRRECGWAALIPATKQINFKSSAQAEAAQFRGCKICKPAE